MSPRSAHGTDLSTMRRLNASAVLTMLWDEVDGLTATELSGRSGLSRSTIDTLLTGLIDEHLVRSDLPATSGVGRPARRYTIAADSGVVIGLDLGPRAITGAVGNLRGSPVAPVASLQGDFLDADAAVEAATRLVDRLVAGTRHSIADVRSLMVAVPAVVDRDGRASLSNVAPDWVERDLTGRIGAALPTMRVRVDNDTKLAAVAELDHGGIDPRDTAILLRVDERVSSATVLDGVVARGAHGAAGEIGALRQLGWLDGHLQFASDGSGEERMKAIGDFAEMIADGLAALVLAIDADAVVVIAGEDSVSSDLAIALDGALAGRTLYPPRVRPSGVGRTASLDGAILAASRQVRQAMLER